jgi:hypothetical protein
MSDLTISKTETKLRVFNIIKMLGNFINSRHLLRHTFTTLSTVSTRVTRRLEKIAQILEKVAQRATKPKYDNYLHYPLLNSINNDNKSYFHPKIFWPFKK